MSRRDTAIALPDIIQEIHEDGTAVIGPRWTLLQKMTALAARGNVSGMVTYYERCLTSGRGQRTGGHLSAAGKKSLESENGRFMAIARPYLRLRRLRAVVVVAAVAVLAAALLRLIS